MHFHKHRAEKDDLVSRLLRPQPFHYVGVYFPMHCLFLLDPPSLAFISFCFAAYFLAILLIFVYTECKFARGRCRLLTLGALFAQPAASFLASLSSMRNDNLRLFCWHSTFAFATPNDFLPTHICRHIHMCTIAIRFNVALLTLLTLLTWTLLAVVCWWGRICSHQNDWAAIMWANMYFLCFYLSWNTSFTYVLTCKGSARVYVCLFVELTID